MTDKQFKPGDVEIISVVLYADSGARKYNLIQQCQHIDIYESILSPYICGELHILDSNDLLRQFPIISEEYIEISFRTPGNDSVNSYNLRVKNIKNVAIQNQQKTKKYILTLISQEVINDAKTRVDQKFELEISSSVKTIATDFLKTTKPITVEPTRGIDSLLLSRLSPFTSIDKLRRRAVSRKYLSSSYVFFENVNGYFFTTLEYLFDNNRNKIGNKAFFFNSNANENIDTENFRNIIAYKQIVFSDSIEQISHGGLTNNVGALDLVSGGYKLYNYTNNIAQDKFVFAGKNTQNQHTTKFEKTHGTDTRSTMLVPYSSAKNESFLPEKISILQAYTQKLVQNLIHIHIYGDNSITAGDVIVCHLPIGLGTTSSNINFDRLASGNYLISKIRHMISFGAKPIYTQSCEIINGGFEENV